MIKSSSHWRWVAVVCAAVWAAAVAPVAHADDYPGKPIRLIVAYPAGGSVDLSARRLAEALGREMKASVIVDNRPGANGIIGTETVAKSTADGYTLLFTTMPAHAGNPYAYKTLPYDTVKDFAPVTIVNTVPLVLIALPAFPAKTIAQLIDLAKARPGQIAYASFGTGGMAHLAGVELNLIAGTKMLHVPYKGGGPALADVLAGHVQIFFSGINSALEHIKAGSLQAIAVSGKGRSAVLPNVPAVNETPGFAEYEASVSPVIFAPAKTPGAVVDKLYVTIKRVTNTPEYRKKLELAGEGDPIGSTPAQTAADLVKEMGLLAKLFKAAGITPE